MSQPLSRKQKKDPQATLPFAFDWTRWLLRENDLISGTPSITVTPSGSLVVDSLKAITVTMSPEFDNPTIAGLVTFWLKGGTVGTIYEVTAHIVTTGGREDDRTMQVEVLQR